MQKLGGPEMAADYRKRLSSKMAKQGEILEKANKDKLKVKRLEDDLNQWQDERDKLANEITDLKKSLEAKDELNEEERQKLQQNVEKANKEAAEMQEKLDSMQRQVEKLENDKENANNELEDLRNKINEKKTSFKDVVMTGLEIAGTVAGLVAGEYKFHSLLMGQSTSLI